MKKFFFFLLIILLLIIGIGWFILPKLVTESVESYLAEEVPMQNMQVEIKNNNPIALFFGTLDSITAKGEQVLLDKVTYEEIQIKLLKVDVRVKPLLLERKLVINKVEDGEMTATLHEKELQNYLQEEVSNIKNIAVDLNPKRIQVSGEVDIGGILNGTIQVTGDPFITNNKLIFRPSGFKFNNMGISGLTSNLMKPIKIYDFKHFPIPVTANKLELLPEKVKISGVIHKE